MDAMFIGSPYVAIIFHCSGGENIPDIKEALIYSECDLLDPAQKLKLYMDRRVGGISPKNFKMTGEVSAQL